MPKFLKIMIFFILLFIPSIIGLFAIKKLFPADVQKLEEISFNYLAKKFPILEYYKQQNKNNIIEKNAQPPPKSLEKIDRPLNYLTNKEVYKAICEEDNKNIKPDDEFIGCNKCPKYLQKNNPDFFRVVSSHLGAITKKDENEAIYFMNGCSNDGNISIILKNGYAGWTKFIEFKNIGFDNPPLAFHDDEKVLLFVGKKKIAKETYDKQIIYSLNFRNKKPNSNDIFNYNSSHHLTCNYQFLAESEDPIKVSNSEFSIILDVLGWEFDSDNTECKGFHLKKNTNLNAGTYTLNFKINNDKIKSDSNSQKIITELEKAQEN
jgi:hypothetical protein